jgi:sialidase-1
MRNYDRTNACRQVAFSSDGGRTWTDQQFQQSLVEPICQASIRRIGDRLLFSNPSDPKQRVNLTIQISHDDGSSWEALYRLHPGPSAYSDLAVISDNIAACLYERGRETPYEEIALARFKVPEREDAQ